MLGQGTGAFLRSCSAASSGRLVRVSGAQLLDFVRVEHPNICKITLKVPVDCRIRRQSVLRRSKVGASIRLLPLAGSNSCTLPGQWPR